MKDQIEIFGLFFCFLKKKGDNMTDIYCGG